METIFSFSINYDGPWTSLDKLNFIAEALDQGGIKYDSLYSVPGGPPGDYIVVNPEIPEHKVVQNRYVDYFYNNIHVTAMLPEEKDDDSGD